MMELDTKGLRCPLPVLKAKKAIKSLEPGDLICILSNDPASKRDFPAYCKNAGHQLIELNEEGEVFSFVIRKGGSEMKQAS